MFPQLDSLIQEIAAVAAGDLSRRADVLATLQRMTRQGWELEPVVQRIWAGERDGAALTHRLDAHETQITQDVLTLLELAGPLEAETLPAAVQAALAGLPASIRDALQAALQSRDEAAFEAAYRAAWGQLSNQQDEQLRQALAAWASQAGPGSQESPEQAAVQRQAMLMSLPITLRLALLDQDPAALQEALRALPPEQAAGLLDQIVQAGFFRQAEQRSLAQEVYDLEPVLQALAVAAGGGLEARLQAENSLAYLEAQGLHLRQVIERIGEGERNEETLCAGLDERERRVIERLLDLLADGATF